MMPLVAQAEKKSDRQCWECLKRRLVCDNTLPHCLKCHRAGRLCPGYNKQRPLQWLKPGKVTARRRRDIEQETEYTIRIKDSPRHRQKDRTKDHANTLDCSVCQYPKANCNCTVIGNAIDRLANEFLRRSIGSDMQLADPIPLPSWTRRDAELLHFYASRTSLTLSGWKTLPIWQRSTLEDAKSHQFLMHSLLALSALHGSLLQVKRSNYFAMLANRHHEKALAGFRMSVVEVTSDNSEAIALFSLLTAIFSCGVPVFREFESDSSPIAMFTDIIGMMRRAWSALGSQVPKIQQGRLKVLVKPCDYTNPRFIDGTSQKLIDYLTSYINNCGESQENKDAYFDALYCLYHYFWTIPDNSPFSDLYGWPLRISDRFFELLREKKPCALILLSYFFTPMSQAPSMWLQPWARAIVKETWNILDGPFRRFLEWPASRVGMRPQFIHPEICRCLDCYLQEKSPDFRWKQSVAALLINDTSK